MRGLIFLAVVYFIKWLDNEISKPDVSKVDQLINTIAEKKTVKYISNGVELKTTLKRHYFDILDMEDGKVYDREMISEQVFKQHSFYNEDVKVGYKTRYNTKDIHLAEDYVLDYYDYVVQNFPCQVLCQVFTKNGLKEVKYEKYKSISFLYPIDYQ